MLHDRQQLDVGEPKSRDVVCQLMCDRPITTGLIPPGPEVKLVDRYWGVKSIPCGARRHPVGVPPLVFEVPHNRSGTRRFLRLEGHGICFVEYGAIWSRDPILVDSAVTNVSHITTPDTRWVGDQLDAV
jgi:hypothetical protein